MSGCSSGQAGSQFCESCKDYSCSSNPHYISYYPDEDAEDPEDPEAFYKENNLEHLKGVKAPDIPIIDIEEETKRQIRDIWDNF